MIGATLQTGLLMLVGFSIACTLLAHLCTWYYFARYRRVYPPTGYAPAVSIVKPTRGVDQTALDNFRSFCEQEYPSAYEILFCVEERSDPVVPVIEQIIHAYPNRQVRLIFSDPQDTQSVGKLKNMIAGYMASAYDVIIFSDSDAHAPPTFIRDTVACVASPVIGLGFSAPAYVCAQDWQATLMNLSVNELVLKLATVCLLGLFDGAVGTTMVARREVIEQIGGLTQFGRQITDDIPLARAIRARGYRIHLLRQPARVVHRHDTLRRWWSHMHRWQVIIRHYWPLKSLFTNLVDLAPWWGLLAVVLALLQQERIAGSIALLGAALAVSLLSAIVVELRFACARPTWRFVWLVPLQECLRLSLFIHSCLTNEIVWRGRRFYINRDCTTRIVDPMAAAYERP